MLGGMKKNVLIVAAVICLFSAQFMLQGMTTVHNDTDAQLSIEYTRDALPNRHPLTIPARREVTLFEPYSDATPRATVDIVYLVSAGSKKYTPSLYIGGGVASVGDSDLCLTHDVSGYHALSCPKRY